MIEINLLPEELRVKAKVRKPAALTAEHVGAGVSGKKVIYIIIALVSLLVCAHIVLFALGIKEKAGLSSLEAQWKAKQQQKKEVDLFNREYSLNQEDAVQLQNILRQRITWSDKLNKLSLYLPAGVWFNELSVGIKDFSLYGAAVSLQKEELGLINKFLDALKADMAFFKDFTKLELSSVQKKSIGGYDVSEFVLQGEIKAK